MSFYAVMNQAAVIFLIMVIGFVLKRLGLINRQISKGVTEILLNVAIPAIIIASFNAELPEAALGGAGVVLLFGVVSLTAAALIGGYLFRGYSPGTKAVMSFSAVFTNCAFMGYPVMDSIFGSIGVFYASIYGIVFNLFLWTYGQIVFTGAKESKMIKQAILNPGTVAVGIGLLLMLTPLKLPGILTQTIEMVGAMTTPLAMIVIGAMLAEVDFREMFRGYCIYYATILRLVVFPGLAWGVLALLGVEQEIAAACTLLTAMPVASNTVLFSDKFDGDSLLASRIVALSTALAIITIPLVAVIVLGNN